MIGFRGSNAQPDPPHLRNKNASRANVETNREDGPDTPGKEMAMIVKLDEFIIYSISGSVSGSGHGGKNRFARANQVRNMRVSVRHKPTGMEDSSEFGPARMSKGEWKKKKDLLFREIVARMTKRLNCTK